jgi:hypothetical protein
MLLVLEAIVFFTLVGLSAKTFGRRQQSLIAAAAVGLAAVQFAFPRFL